MGQESLKVLKHLIKMVCWTKNGLCMATYKIKGEFSHLFILNSLKTEGNFVVKLFYPLYVGLQSGSRVECKLDPVTSLKLNVVVEY